MKKMMITTLALVLAFSIVGAGWAAPPPLLEPAPGKAQAACPVQGGKINKDLYVDYQGQRVYFCCPACIDIFKKDPEKYLREMRRQGVTPERTPDKK